MAGLPDEVVARLSVHGPVRLEVGGDADPVVVPATIVPLPRQLYALVQPQVRFAEVLGWSARASFTAEDPGGEYMVRVRSRAALGRNVNGDPRRAELMYWLPEGWKPHQTWVVRLHPEEVEYVKGKGAERSRAAGLVPGGELPATPSRWIRLAREGVVLWYFAMLAVLWVGLLVLGIPEGTRVLLLVLMLVGCVAATGGIAILNQRWTYLRYREGLAEERDAALVLEGWAAPEVMLRVGVVGVALCVVVALILSLGGGLGLGLVTMLGSGLWLFGPFYGVRYLLRTKDREEP